MKHLKIVYRKTHEVFHWIEILFSILLVVYEKVQVVLLLCSSECKEYKEMKGKAACRLQRKSPNADNKKLCWMLVLSDFP
jgi:hypothetical protein